jgi:hypothetical protein
MGQEANILERHLATHPLERADQKSAQLILGIPSVCTCGQHIEISVRPSNVRSNDATARRKSRKVGIELLDTLSRQEAPEDRDII